MTSRDLASQVAYHNHMGIGLRMLAEIYRAAREMWPLHADAAGRSVTIHIGKMRGLRVLDEISISPYREGQLWVLVQTSDQEGVVQLEEATGLPALLASGRPLRFLRFWPGNMQGPDKGASPDGECDAQV